MGKPTIHINRTTCLVVIRKIEKCNLFCKRTIPTTSLSRVRRTTANMMQVAGWPKTASSSTTTTARATSCSRSSRKWRCAAASSPLLIRSGSKPNWASVSAPSARAGVTTGRATACSPASCVPTARKSRSPTTPSAAASARHTQELPRTSFGTATCHCTNGRKKARW